MNPQVDEFLERAKKWADEMRVLRSIVLSCGLTEELKWKQPCYTYNGQNILIISAFKEFACLSFIKGVFLADEKGILTMPGENSRSVRFFKTTNVKDIEQLENTLREYIFEAIEVEKAGLKVAAPKEEDLDLPEELKTKMDQDPDFEKAFMGLTPGRRRAYVMHISEAKQSATRSARIEKFVPRIMKGKGMNDCICGLSKRMPNCDGSHKQLKEHG